MIVNLILVVEIATLRLFVYKLYKNQKNNSALVVLKCMKVFFFIKITG